VGESHVSDPQPRMAPESVRGHGTGTPPVKHAQHPQTVVDLMPSLSPTHARDFALSEDTLDVGCRPRELQGGRVELAESVNHVHLNDR